MFVCLQIVFRSLTSGIKARFGLRTMAGEEQSAPRITKFDGSDYSYWWMQMEDFLFSKKLHLPLGSKPMEMKVKD